MGQEDLRIVRKRYSDKDVMKTLLEIDYHLPDGFDVVSSSRNAGISDSRFYYWRKKFGGMELGASLMGWGGTGQKCPRISSKKAQMVVKDEAASAIVACPSWKEI